MVLGKSTITSVISKKLSKGKKKTIIIDFDIYNKSISVLYNKFLKNTDYENLKNNIIKVSEYEDLLYVEENFLENNKIFELIKDLKAEYDKILIDTPGDLKIKFFGRILEISDDVVFVITPTLCDLKKAINAYEILNLDFNVPKEKIKLLINKENKYSVDNLIIKKIFAKEKICAVIKYNEAIENNINGKVMNKMYKQGG